MAQGSPTIETPTTDHGNPPPMVWDRLFVDGVAVVPMVQNDFVDVFAASNPTTSPLSLWALLVEQQRTALRVWGSSGKAGPPFVVPVSQRGKSGGIDRLIVHRMIDKVDERGHQTRVRTH
jgi:hypothetical protein